MRPRTTLALLIVLLALAVLPANAPMPATAQTTPERIDEPPVFEIYGALAPVPTYQITWKERSNAAQRWLFTPRGGVLFHDFGRDWGILPFYVLYPTRDQWRLGEPLTLCRRWAATETEPERTSCHTSSPLYQHTEYLPVVVR